LAKLIRNIEEGDIIYWTQGLCPNREKFLALGGRGLEGLDQESCPSANFTDKVLKQVAERLRAKMVYSNIRERCIREERDGRDGRNCLPATVEEAERLAEVICVIAELAHLKEAKFISQNCGGKSITKKLIPKIKKLESSAPTIAFVNENSNHLSFYDYQCTVCFCTGELQKYWIYLDLQNMYVDLKKAVGDESMPFIFDELLNWARQLKMVVDHRTKTPEMMEVLQNEWKAYGRSRIAPLHRAYEIKRLRRKLEVLTKASDDTTEQKIKLEMEITRLESETLEERTQRKEEEDDRKKEEARQQKKEKEEARKRKEEEEDRKKEEARKRKEEARQQKKEKEEARQRKEEEKDRKKEDAWKRKEEEDDRKKEEARKRKKEEEDQAQHEALH
jgi:DNA segregation ATPase FtsK/SpoIIIE-like protein